MANTSEIQGYLARAWQDLKAAEQILSDGFYHVTVTRSYYAMFYAAQALLLSQNVRRHRHAGVLSAFSEYLVKTGLIETEYAKLLGQTFESRLDSDYDVTFTTDLALAEQVLRDAQQFVQRTEQYLEQAGVL